MPKPIDPRKIKRVLLVRTDRMGDVIFTTPIFSAIKNQRPDLHVAVLIAKENRQLIEGNPSIDEVILYDKKGSEKSLLGAFKFTQMLRAKKFDAAILLHPRARNYWTAFFARIPIRIGYQKKNYWLLTHSFYYDKPEGKKHEARYSFDFLKFIGVSEPKVLEPYIPLIETFRQEAEALLPNKPFVVLNPSASTLSKIWPFEYFAKVGDELIQKYGVEVVLTSGEVDAKFTKAVKDAMQYPPIDLTGKLKMGALPWVFKRAKLFISNDSGPAHMGAAVKTPTISLFLRNVPGLGPSRWHPLGPNSIYLLEEVVKTNEFANTGVITKDLIHTLTPELVLKTIEEKGWLNAYAVKN